MGHGVVGMELVRETIMGETARQAMEEVAKQAMEAQVAKQVMEEVARQAMVPVVIQTIMELGAEVMGAAAMVEAVKVLDMEGVQAGTPQLVERPSPRMELPAGAEEITRATRSCMREDDMGSLHGILKVLF